MVWMILSILNVENCRLVMILNLADLSNQQTMTVSWEFAIKFFEKLLKSGRQYRIMLTILSTNIWAKLQNSFHECYLTIRNTLVLIKEPFATAKNIRNVIICTKTVDDYDIEIIQKTSISPLSIKVFYISL